MARRWQAEGRKLKQHYESTVAKLFELFLGFLLK